MSESRQAVLKRVTPKRESQKTPRAEHYFLPRDHFLRALYLEQRRAERTGHELLLMLAGAKPPHRFEERGSMAELVTAIQESIRETDTIGWHVDGERVGVVFTGLLYEGDSTPLERIASRMERILQRRLSDETFEHLQIEFHRFPDDWSQDGSNPSTRLVLYQPDDPSSRAKVVSRIVKRGIDIIGSLVGLALLSPFLILIAAGVKLSSRGPVLYRQTRVGQFGRRFTFLKFRSMHQANDASEHQRYVKQLISSNQAANGDSAKHKPVYKLTNDKRVTALGKLLRRSSLDELPQLLNVLWGDMSLVGPRPPIPYEVDCYKSWHRRRLLAVKPGITGLWQVSGRNRISFDDMVRLDLKYAKTWSIWMDLVILAKTPRAVLSGDGAY